MGDLISVIIPVYNTERYLDKCLNSVVGQTYKALEIILVDDGSTDSSGRICDEWEKKDSRIKVVHKENEGQGIARNKALDICNGQYVAFVDSDDWIEHNTYESLFKDIVDFNADVACCRGMAEADDLGDGKTFCYIGENILCEHLKGGRGTSHSPCDKLYKRSLWQNVRFAKLRAYEDCATIYRVLNKAQRMVYRNIGLYHYTRRENSTMTQTFSSIKFQAIHAYYQMYNDIKQWYPNLKYKVKELLLGSIQYCVGETLKAHKKNELKEEYEKALQIARSISPIGLKLKQRISLFLIKKMPTVYGIFYKIIK